MLAAGLGLSLTLVVADSVRDSTVGSWTAFFAGALLIAGTIGAVLLGSLRALALMDQPVVGPGAQELGVNERS